MAVHFKFKSARDYDSVDIDGPFISVASLKERIIEFKKLGMAAEIDLVITNAQSGEDYTDESFLVPKNTSVSVRRLPSARPKPTLQVKDEAPKQVAAGNNERYFGGNLLPPPRAGDATGARFGRGITHDAPDGPDDFGSDFYETPDVHIPPQPRADAEEYTRIQAMVNSTATEWQRQTYEGYHGGGGGGGRGFNRGGFGGRGNYGGGFGRGGFSGRGFVPRGNPPPGYVCHRCGQPGHFIQLCPTNGDPSFDMKRVKIPVGIPKTMLVANQDGSYLLPSGEVAVMQPNESVFEKEADALLSAKAAALEPPPDMRCPICKGIFKDAVMIPCCQISFCDRCIRQELMAKGKCPQCSRTNIMNDDLLPNLSLRKAVDRFVESHITSSAEETTPTRRNNDAGITKKASSGTVSRSGEGRTELLPVSDAAESMLKDEVGETAKGGSASPLPAVGRVGKEPLENGISLVSLTRKPVAAASGAAAADIKKSDVVMPDVASQEKSAGGPKSEPAAGGDGKSGTAGAKTASGDDTADGAGGENAAAKAKKKKPKRVQRAASDGTPAPGDAMPGPPSNNPVQKGRPPMMSGRGERLCYTCHAPDHFMRDCPENVGLGGHGPVGGHVPLHVGGHPSMHSSSFQPSQQQLQPSMLGPGGPLYPGILPPFGGIGEGGGFFPGPAAAAVLQQQAPHPNVGYGSVFGPTVPSGVPFDRVMQNGPFVQQAPFAPISAPFHGGVPLPHSGSGDYGSSAGPVGMMRPVDAPLSREEFLQLQEEERRRRAMQARGRESMAERPLERSFAREESNFIPSEAPFDMFMKGKRRAPSPDMRRRDQDYGEYRRREESPLHARPESPSFYSRREDSSPEFRRVEDPLDMRFERLRRSADRAVNEYPPPSSRLGMSQVRDYAAIAGYDREETQEARTQQRCPDETASGSGNGVLASRTARVRQLDSLDPYRPTLSDAFRARATGRYAEEDSVRELFASTDEAKYQRARRDAVSKVQDYYCPKESDARPWRSQAEEFKDRTRPVDRAVDRVVDRVVDRTVDRGVDRALGVDRGLGVDQGVDSRVDYDVRSEDRDRKFSMRMHEDPYSKDDLKASHVRHSGAHLDSRNESSRIRTDEDLYSSRGTRDAVITEAENARQQIRQRRHYASDADTDVGRRHSDLSTGIGGTREIGWDANRLRSDAYESRDRDRDRERDDDDERYDADKRKKHHHQSSRDVYDRDLKTGVSSEELDSESKRRKKQSSRYEADKRKKHHHPHQSSRDLYDRDVKPAGSSDELDSESKRRKKQASTTTPRRYNNNQYDGDWGVRGNDAYGRVEKSSLHDVRQRDDDAWAVRRSIYRETISS